MLVLIQYHFVIHLSNNATRIGDKIYIPTIVDKIQIIYENMFLCGSSMYSNCKQLPNFALKIFTSVV